MNEEGKGCIKMITFLAVIKSLQRYIFDDTFVLKNTTKTEDIFDITLATKSRQAKFLLHPSCNYMINRCLIKINSLVRIIKYESYVDELSTYENKNIYMLKEMEVLDFDGGSSLPTDENFPVDSFFSSKPLVTSRGYYMHFYNNEDCYGLEWKENNLKQMEPKIVLSIDQLNTQCAKKHFSKPFPPVYGTVITKSKLTYFGKHSNSDKCPYLFTIEIESNGVSCNVSFWNTTCFSFYKSIKVGQVLVLKNYRVKRRYGQRSNTVFSFSESAEFELSINPANPEGEVGLSSQKPSFIPYKFKTSLSIKDHKVANEQIYDVIGIIVFVGRMEREVKKTEKVDSFGDFWSFRWIELKTEENGLSIKVKLYSSSQSNVIDSMLIGDIFIGTRLLCKIDIIEFCGKQRLYSHFTSTKESQFYKFDKDWKCEDLKNLPFFNYSEVLDVFLLHKDVKSMSTILQSSYIGGWYSYPPFSDTLRGFKSSINSDLKVVLLEDLCTLIKNLHFYQHASVNVLSTIAGIEVVQKNGTLSSQIILNERYSYNSTNGITLLGSKKINQQDAEDFLGTSQHVENSDTFIRLYLLDVNKTFAIYVYLKPQLGTEDCTFVEMLSGHSMLPKDLNDLDSLRKKVLAVPVEQRFLVLLDLYYYGNERTEIVLNRAFVLPS